MGQAGGSLVSDSHTKRTQRGEHNKRDVPIGNLKVPLEASDDLAWGRSSQRDFCMSRKCACTHVCTHTLTSHEPTYMHMNVTHLGFDQHVGGPGDVAVRSSYQTRCGLQEDKEASCQYSLTILGAHSMPGTILCMAVRVYFMQTPYGRSCLSLFQK